MPTMFLFRFVRLLCSGQQSIVIENAALRLSPSDADLALLMKLAFYSNKDRHMMDAIFSASPLSKNFGSGQCGRTKEMAEDEVGQPEVPEKNPRRAIDKTSAVYTPRKKSQ